MKTIKDFSDVQAKKAAGRYWAKRDQFIWANVRVKYCQDEAAWIVYGYFRLREDKKPEILASQRLKKDAIAEAQLYAFDTSAGPQRSEHVYTYNKRGELMDAFYIDNRGRLSK